MKKNLCFCLILVFCAAACLTFFGCGDSLSAYDPIISEVRDRVYEGGGEHFKAVAVSGRHERPFKADGTAGAKGDFTVLTVTPEEFAPNMVCTYALTIGGTAYTGVLSVHPFGESFSVELETRALEETLTVTLKMGSSSQTVELACVNDEDDITPAHALDTAISALSESLAPLKSGSHYDCEIYVRMIPNPINGEGGYYWYAAFVTKDGKTYAALIDRKTAKVIGVKG